MDEWIELYQIYHLAIVYLEEIVQILYGLQTIMSYVYVLYLDIIVPSSIIRQYVISFVPTSVHCPCYRHSADNSGSNFTLIVYALTIVDLLACR